MFGVVCIAGPVNKFNKFCRELSKSLKPSLKVYNSHRQALNTTQAGRFDDDMGDKIILFSSQEPRMLNEKKLQHAVRALVVIRQAWRHFRPPLASMHVMRSIGLPITAYLQCTQTLMGFARTVLPQVNQMPFRRIASRIRIFFIFGLWDFILPGTSNV